VVCDVAEIKDNLDNSIMFQRSKKLEIKVNVDKRSDKKFETR